MRLLRKPLPNFYDVQEMLSLFAGMRDEMKQEKKDREENNKVFQTQLIATLAAIAQKLESPPKKSKHS